MFIFFYIFPLIFTLVNGINDCYWRSNLHLQGFPRNSCHEIQHFIYLETTGKFVDWKMLNHYKIMVNWKKTYVKSLFVVEFPGHNSKQFCRCFLRVGKSIVHYSNHYQANKPYTVYNANILLPLLLIRY